LTEAVRRKPYSVVLFDEVEKAHPDVFNIFLQILDDGRITDSHGRTVDFKNTILIMTSNLGADLLLSGIDADGNISPEAVNGVDMLLKQQFRPELINRLDEIVYFKPLTKANIRSIIELLVNDINERLEDKELILRVSDSAADFIADEAYDPSFGARPLRRYLQKHVETMLAKLILSDKVHQGDVIMLDVDDGTLKMSKQ
ncbi:MAG: AAA family ATPase, partial [Eubacterium sp.]|nr:AAA family ATPase [Eubacterium sp.]